jgi:hypothetical protein
VNFASAAIVDEGQVQVVKISAVRSKDRLGEIHVRKAELKLCEILLDSIVRHAVVAELTCNIALDHVAPYITDAGQGEVSAEGCGM